MNPGETPGTPRRDPDPFATIPDPGPSTPAPTTPAFAPGNEEDEAVGHVLGRYKLLEKLGEGGCGVVYAAEQTEPVRRRVALKVIKLGMDTKAVVARFEAERQALAMMDHPNIARVLDAGTTGRGRPFFVMELVRGVRITEYCDENHLPTPARLELLVQVCHAIQHAHQKGIIHRDIKPSNILVTLHDGVPVPKVIAFGIAKATEGRLSESTVYTQLHQFIGTPAYMSPEQAEMSGLDIDTRSDIYSLGVLLYELLTGRTPFDAEKLASLGLDGMRRAIKESEAPTPSRRVQTLAGDELTTTARRRSVEGARLVGELRGDLDWIVMKCLEKDRTRRYETANGLAADLRRHLANEPVTARPPSASYLFRKAVRRNKLAFAAAAAVVLALVAGLGTSVWQATRALRAKAAAEAATLSARASEKRAKEAEAGQSRLRAEAERQARIARRHAYNSEINLAQQALAANNLGRARDLLARQVPGPGETDLRGWEWRYLWGQARADDHDVLARFEDRPGGVEFGPDGRTLGLYGNDGLRIVDLISRRTVFERTNSIGCTFLPGQRDVVIATATNNPAPAAISVLDLATGSEKPIPTPGNLYDILGLPGRRVLVWSREFTRERVQERPVRVDLVDLDSARVRWTIRLTGAEAGIGRTATASRDGRRLAVGATGGRVEVYDLEDGTRLLDFKATDERILALGFSSDGAHVLSGAGYTDPVIRVWDARTGAAAGTLAGHRSYVTDILATADGRHVVSSSGDQTIRVWDFPSRSAAGVLRGHQDEVDGLALAPDGRTLVSRCKDGSVFLWDLEKRQRNPGYRTLPGPVALTTGIAFSADGNVLAATTRDAKAAWWNLETLAAMDRGFVSSTNHYHVACLDADRLLVSDRAGRVRIWDARTRAESDPVVAGRTPTRTLPLAGGRLVATFEPATITNELRIDIWTPTNWTRLRTFAMPMEGIGSMVSTRQPDHVAFRTNRGVLSFDLSRDGFPALAFPCRHGASALAASPDGKWVAVADEGAMVQVFDAATGRLRDSVRGFLLGAHSVAYSEDGNRVLAGGNGAEAVKCWDAETLDEMLTLPGEGSMFAVLRFGPGERRLVGINIDGKVHVWPVPTWDEIKAAEARDAKAAPGL